MPTRTDLQSILILGSGPIVIGQAAEFDYSGTQAVRLREDSGCFAGAATGNAWTRDSLAMVYASGVAT